METEPGRRCCAKRGRKGLQVSGQSAVAAVDRISPRSRAETKMNCVKLLGQGLMARDFDRQVAELRVRIAVLNRYTALGIPVTEAVG